MQAAVAWAVDERERRLGPLSQLVNNAGTPGPSDNDWEVDIEARWECITVDDDLDALLERGQDFLGALRLVRENPAALRS